MFRYLQQNCLTKIENLDALIHLDALNVSQNMIEKIDGLEKLTNLHTRLSNTGIYPILGLCAILVICIVTVVKEVQTIVRLSKLHKLQQE